MPHTEACMYLVCTPYGICNLESLSKKAPVQFISYPILCGGWVSIYVHVQAKNDISKMPRSLFNGKCYQNAELYIINGICCWQCNAPLLSAT
jgi:hypothetical protein